MSLNRIIYYLVVLLVIQLLIFAIYLSMNDTKATNNNTPQLNTLTTFPNKIRTKTSVKSKIEPIKEIAKPLVLEDVLVHVSPNSKLDIVSIENENVKPVIYTKSIKLSELSIKNKKKIFIDMLIPSILVAKHRIAEERKKVRELLSREHFSEKETLWLAKKRHIFKAKNIDELYNKMELHPTSIVIAQAIIESGWGTSRFFEKANNVFGIWSFYEHEKRIAASEKRGTKTIYLKKYMNVEESIFDYFLMLSTKEAYKEFREKRLESQDPLVLIKELGNYSELGDEYIENLKNTIEKNELLAYDSYSLDI
ncbi:MAG: BAX protein [uncultured Sulfurovum sp.]|uniref:BAX protein n=1 Tax=uncultured Sulfurovum sp. TaxID=269237 RepID=A0A6S6UA90_9BACT|nr:MAG: BAX protein [uncultured Sulfurovum sp.]